MSNDTKLEPSINAEHKINVVHDVLVVDDEPAARHKLILFLQDHKDFRVVAQAQNGIEALECIEKYSPALVFLDIQMPLLDGMSVASNIEYTKDIGVVFVTGFNEYAIKAFELNAVDYLLKPYDKARLAKTLARFREFTGTISQYNIPKIIQDYRAEQHFPEKLLFKSEGAIEVVSAPEIQWIESSGNYVKVCLERTAFIARQTITTVQSQLDPEQFIRIRRTHIVNKNEVVTVDHISKGDYQITLKSGTTLRLSRGYKTRFFEVFGA
ncbi:LytR/AlgR family response regulator transcription factor [Colwellia psychrerythraea]|uniref:Two component transcriptional regulator, LytTR family n=1 Tax=Colwellia psychrerythraea TaxID=28229 RepID=A0A099KKQ4_COLPS|nr:LytTR family DNA-binding domain-containing protein [Colwellia psychrerythraea]KGJ90133.1 two component transcriptional regulator, LytTR family [Colwellia psychrerythraea]